MKPPVHVVCAANRGYMMPLSVMLASLIDNFDPQRDLLIHIISNDASDQDRENVRASIELNRPGLEHLGIHWYSYDPSLLSGLQVLSYFTLDTYSRLLAPLLLPESCDKVIYLDCDLIVLKDISQLYDSVTDDFLIHAAQDLGTPFVSSSLGVFDYQKRGIPPDTVYFNAGVMVINFKKWRKLNITQAALDYLAESGPRLHAQDQGALNGLCYHDRALIDLRWNQGFDIMFFHYWKKAGYSRDEWNQLRNDPYIVHYSGAKKPWQKGRRGPRYSYFFKYLAKTVFKDSLPGHPVLESVIGLRAYFYLWNIASTLRTMINHPPEGYAI